jgi:hypothetical protein
MTTPTQIGWYWFRPSAGTAWRMVRIRTGDLVSYLVADFYPGTQGLPLDQVGNRCEWHGPLLPPGAAGKELS